MAHRPYISGQKKARGVVPRAWFGAWRFPTFARQTAALSSALSGFTSEFGMGSGGARSLWSPSNSVYNSHKAQGKEPAAEAFAPCRPSCPLASCRFVPAYAATFPSFCVRLFLALLFSASASCGLGLATLSQGNRPRAFGAFLSPWAFRLYACCLETCTFFLSLMRLGVFRRAARVRFSVSRPGPAHSPLSTVFR
jgi:hypothetical protein